MARVLIIDDDANFVKTLREEFRSQTRQSSRRINNIVSVNSREKANEVLQTMLADAVILSENMLDEVGLELLRKLQRTFGFIQIIILSTSIHDVSADKQLAGIRFTRYDKQSTTAKAVAHAGLIGR